jgi:hypothetical protein
MHKYKKKIKVTNLKNASQMLLNITIYDEHKLDYAISNYKSEK